MKHWLFNCKDISHLVSRSMDEQLPLYRRMGITFHLMMCRYCARYARQLKIIRQKIQSLSGVSTDPAIKPMPANRKEALKKMLSQK